MSWWMWVWFVTVMIISLLAGTVSDGHSSRIIHIRRQRPVRNKTNRGFSVRQHLMQIWTNTISTIRNPFPRVAVIGRTLNIVNALSMFINNNKNNHGHRAHNATPIEVYPTISNITTTTEEVAATITTIIHNFDAIATDDTTEACVDLTTTVHIATAAVPPVLQRNTIIEEQLQIACDFLGYTSRTECQSATYINSQRRGSGKKWLLEQIPSELGLLTRITHLDLRNWHLIGTIPSVLGHLVRLKNFDVAFNMLNGTIPSTFGYLTQLIWLDLYTNQFTGTIPSTIGNLKQLTRMTLSSNQLNGTIPPTLGSLKTMVELTLDYNQLTGTIPPTLGQLQGLRKLDLEYNKLTGTIPSTFGRLKHITWLDVSRNQLAGTIPSILGNLRRLTLLHFHGNQQLFGTVPSALCSEATDIFIDCHKQNIVCRCCRDAGTWTIHICK